jgi:hypothetical protein
MKTHFASILLIVLPISHYSNAAEEAPNIPGLTVVEQGLVKIKDIKSDPFTMTEVKIIGGVIRIKVSYAGGHKDHDFTLYRGNTVKESNPPQVDVYLKHNANGDKAEALLMKTLEFNLADLNKPIIITVHTDHGGKETVKYGENNTNAEQGGADEPATAPELKSEGKDKPQPESKVRPR